MVPKTLSCHPIKSFWVWRRATGQMRLRPTINNSEAAIVVRTISTFCVSDSMERLSIRLGDL